VEVSAEKSALRQKRHTFDSNTNGLLYLQLETELKQAILDGKYGVGERIPTEQELCQSFGMSRITVRRAVQDLVEEGLLSKVQGRGTFVAVPKHVLGSTESLGRGFGGTDPDDHGTHRLIIEKSAEHADKELAGILGISTGDDIFYIRRLIIEEDYPMAIDNLFVAAAMFPDLPDLLLDDISFYRLIDEHYQYEFGDESLTLDASTARGDEGQLLQCPTGSPLFILRKSMARADGKILHYSKSIIRADRVSYHFDVNRDGRIINRGKDFALTVDDAERQDRKS
jgi:DNA-binding GntR family transcriptional regulator